MRPKRVPEEVAKKSYYKVELVIGLLGDLFGHQFRHALNVDGRAGGAGPLGDGIGHRLDMAVGGIVENENLGHFGLLGLN
jgi:hypothetical protein